MGAVCSVDGVSNQFSIYFIAVHRATAAPSDVRILTYTHTYIHTYVYISTLTYIFAYILTYMHI